MKVDVKVFSLFASVILWVSLPRTTQGQIVPDSTLPNVSRVPDSCLSCEITGGTQVGQNLFHSFDRFSIPAGGSAYFNQPPTVQNIFARVTGRSPSTLNGELRANGTANLFLLNPNGILFGRNASLNIGGSFYATTGDRIRFSDRTEFSASQITPTLLTVSVPIGIQFGPTAGPILNRSQARPGGAENTLREAVGLRVNPGQAIALLGQGVTLSNGNLTARSGQIELGSISANHSVSLVRNPSGSFGVQYPGGITFANLSLLNRSLIDTSGELPLGSGGAISLRGREIRLGDRSTLNSITYGGVGGTLGAIASQSILLSSNSSIGTFMAGTGKAGDIVVRAADEIQLTGTVPSFIAAQTLRNSSGNAGNIDVQAGSVVLNQGASIEASSFSRGNGGSIRVRANFLEVSGFNPEPFLDAQGRLSPVGFLTSGILSQTNPVAGSSANAGSLTVEAQRLILGQGGFISTATFTGGRGGRLEIRARESVQISGASPIATRNQYRSGIFVSAEPGATGSVGTLLITTPQLVMGDRAEIAANNRGLGQPGTATLNVGNLLLQGGSEIRASSIGNRANNFTAGAGGTLTVNAARIRLSGVGVLPSESTIGTLEQFPSSLAALTTSSGAAGNLQIQTGLLEVGDRAEISVLGTRSGAAGNLTITAPQVFLNNGQITASTNAGSGAQINLQGLDLLLLRNQSQMTAEAFNQGNGGNVTILAPKGFVIAPPGEDSNIVANAFGGDGGNILIQAQSILGLVAGQSLPGNGSNDIDASSALGRPGTITLLQPEADPSRGLTALPTDLTDASRQIARGCNTSSTATRVSSQFVVSGRGGLPPAPEDPLPASNTTAAWVRMEGQLQGSDRLFRSNALTPARPTPLHRWGNQNRLVEAQGWVRNDQGAIALVAIPPKSSPLNLPLEMLAHSPARVVQRGDRCPS